MKNLNEIERKWLVPNFPDAEPVKIQDVFVSYVHSSDDVEVRIQERNVLHGGKKNEHPYKLTIKLGNGLIRKELETEISQKTYESWLTAVPFEPVHKLHKRYTLPDELFLEVSIVDNDWYYAEIEFPTVEEAQMFPTPVGWVDVTENPFYQMKNYWRRKYGI